jgi:hypothetical protein
MPTNNPLNLIVATQDQSGIGACESHHIVFVSITIN